MGYLHYQPHLNIRMIFFCAPRRVCWKYLWRIEAIVAGVDSPWLGSRLFGYTMLHPRQLPESHRRYLSVNEKTRRSASWPTRSTHLVCIAGCRSRLGDWSEHRFCIAMYSEVYRIDRWRSDRIRCVHLLWWISDLPSKVPGNGKTGATCLERRATIRTRRLFTRVSLM